ncbi:MAG: T9SS type A sorting domain-containing protein [Bacteroidia bacterium]|nr:T9SS type A sorting domain-containing protein [Bacteroidia bacterium]
MLHYWLVRWHYRLKKKPNTHLGTNSSVYTKNSASSSLYGFTTFTAPYQEITGTLLTGGQKWDDPDFDVPIGFNFKIYNDQNDTIVFSGGSFGTFDDPANDPVITLAAPMFEDLCDKAFDPNVDSEGDPGGTSAISYTTTGTVGSRTCVIQVKNAGFFGENDVNGTSTSVVNFQLWLYETTNDIEFRFGTTNILNPSDNLENPNGFLSGLAEDLDANSGLCTNSDVLYGPHNNPIKGLLNGVSNVITGQIQSGRVYRFARVNNFVGIDATVQLPEFSIYPNPARNTLFINGNQLSEAASVEFFDVTGKRVCSLPLKNQIDISAFKAGIYFMKICNAEKAVVFSNKLIIAD